MNKTILVTAAFLGLLGIVLGAFAAHGLKGLISTESIAAFETGVRYQMYHAFLLLIIGSTSLLKLKTKKIIYLLTIIGLVFFSGSIYGLSTSEMSGINFKKIALITPIGGLFLISSWLVMLINFLKLKADKFQN